jgi:hypothetical protein
METILSLSSALRPSLLLLPASSSELLSLTLLSSFFSAFVFSSSVFGLSAPHLKQFVLLPKTPVAPQAGQSQSLNLRFLTGRSSLFGFGAPHLKHVGLLPKQPVAPHSAQSQSGGRSPARRFLPALGGAFSGFGALHLKQVVREPKTPVAPH